MPESVDSSLDGIEKNAIKEIKNYVGQTEMKIVQEPIAFGLKAIKIIFTMDEARGSTEELEKTLSTIPEVNSVECIDVRRAIG